MQVNGGARRVQGLYALVDVDVSESLGLDWYEVGAALLRARPCVIQVRAKDRPDAWVLDALRRFRDLIPRGGDTLLFANDRADLAALSGCDGVHLGQSDLAPSLVQRSFPQLLLGLSTHNEVEFLRALDEPIHYLALGPIFSTSSKKNPEPEVGLSELGRLAPRARERGLPLVAIGGITEHDLRAIGPHVSAVAFISALVRAPRGGALSPREITEAALRLREILSESQSNS